MSAEVVAAVKVAGEVAALGITVLTILQVLPGIAALFAMAWYSIVLYERTTGREFKDTRFARWLTRK